MALAHVHTQLTMSGDGLVPPVRKTELWMLLLTKTIGLMLVTLLVASLGAKMVADLRASSRSYMEKSHNLEEFMKTFNVSPTLKAKLRTYLDCKYPVKRAFN